MLRTQGLLERIGVAVPRKAVFQVFDPLIGAYDRSHMPNVVQSLVAGHGQCRGTSCLMISLDSPAQIEESYSPLGIAAAIRELAEIMHEAGGGDSLLVRYRRTVLCIFLPGTRLAEALTVAQRIRHSLAIARIPVPGGVLMTTASIGVASTDSATDIESFALVDATEVAMNKAVRRGNTVQVETVSDLGVAV